MKILTMYHAETTSENFGKKGMSVLGTSALVLKTATLSEAFKPTDGIVAATGTSPTGRELLTQQFFFDHVMIDVGSQDMVAVVMGFEVVLQQMKLMMPGLDTVFWRCDNAGCFVNGFLLYMLPHLGRKYGVCIKVLLHNESGDGKTELDGHFGVMWSTIKARQYC